jgi:hypothetical protein
MQSHHATAATAQVVWWRWRPQERRWRQMDVESPSTAALVDVAMVGSKGGVLVTLERSGGGGSGGGSGGGGGGSDGGACALRVKHLLGRGGASVQASAAAARPHESQSTMCGTATHCAQSRHRRCT